MLISEMKGVLMLSLPFRKDNSKRHAEQATIEPSLSARVVAAFRVPPVARTSSTIAIRFPIRVELFFISRVSCPYSKEYVCDKISPGSLPFFLII